MRTARWLAVFTASTAIFVALALVASFWGVMPEERALYEALVSAASPQTVSIFHTINYLGDKWVLLPATLLLLALAPPRARRRWWLWAGVMIVAALVEGLGKELIGRPRPEGHASGFPSGHVTAAAAYFFLAAYLVSRRLSTPARAPVAALWVAAGVVVVLVGIARIVLQAHWPGDVLGGAALGLLSVSLAVWWHEHASDGPASAPGRDTGSG